MAKNALSVLVYWSPTAGGQSGFNGEAISVTSENKVGKFDILPEHTNFISVIFNRLMIQKTNKDKVDYKFKRGVVEVSDDQVRVFLGV